MTDPTSAAGAAAMSHLKLWPLMPALIGALMMAAARPPKNRQALFYQAFVALAASYLFGNQIAFALDPYVSWVHAGSPQWSDFTWAVHGCIGAFSWGLFGGLGSLRDQWRENPKGFVGWMLDVADRIKGLRK